MNWRRINKTLELQHYWSYRITMHNYKKINFPFVFFVRHVYASYYDSSVKHCLFKTAVNVAIYACLASCFLLNLRSKKRFELL